MEKNVKHHITLVDEPLLATIVHEKAVLSTSNLMLIWGLINFGIWFLSGATDLIPIAFAVSLLVAALLGFLLRLTVTVLVSGLLLIGVGLSNIGFGFSTSVETPQEEPFSLFTTSLVILGLCQIVWGSRQIARYSRMNRWPVKKVPAQDRNVMLRQLNERVQATENVSEGTLKATLTIRGPLGFDFLDRVVWYTGILTEQSLFLVSAALDDYIIVHREASESLHFQYFQDKWFYVTIYEGKRTLELKTTSDSFAIIRQWSGVAVEDPPLPRPM